MMGKVGGWDERARWMRQRQERLAGVRSEFAGLHMQGWVGLVENKGPASAGWGGVWRACGSELEFAQR